MPRITVLDRLVNGELGFIARVADVPGGARIYTEYLEVARDPAQQTAAQSGIDWPCPAEIGKVLRHHIVEFGRAYKDARMPVDRALMSVHPKKGKYSGWMCHLAGDVPNRWLIYDGSYACWDPQHIVLIPLISVLLDS